MRGNVARLQENGDEAREFLVQINLDSLEVLIGATRHLLNFFGVFALESRLLARRY